MIYQIILIVGVTLIAGLLYRARVVTVCPICGGVVLAWLVGLVGIYLDMAWVDPVFTGLLMGGSVGALAEKYGGKNGLIWKSALVLAGFPAVYYLVNKNLVFGVPLGVVALLLVLFTLERKEQLRQKEDMFDDCCG